MLKPTGPYKIAAAGAFFTDPIRLETYAKDGSHRELPVAFWYPADCKTACPLVVFSHGGYGVKTSNRTLYEELASHGYLVCAMDHSYQCFSTRNSKGKKIGINAGFLKETMRDDPNKRPEESFQLHKKWMEIRMGDIHLVIDAIKENANSAELPVYCLADPERIAVMGHSLGGSGALGIGRARDDIAAVAALEAPFMYDVQGVEDGKYVFNPVPYPVPVLNVYSDTAWKSMKHWALYAVNAALLESGRADVVNAHISGIGHFGLTDLSAKPQKTMQLNTICLEFLDRFVR